ncbi:MAG: WG repeat-containing protein [Oscillospiraceae bacterium]|jgi:hypothetical protein|nr:WG repeat-containing protein [Oscillospiraceae bacterium]
MKKSPAPLSLLVLPLLILFSFSACHSPAEPAAPPPAPKDPVPSLAALRDGPALYLTYREGRTQTVWRQSAPDFLYGLINQNGEVVAPEVFCAVQFYSDEDGHPLGLAALRAVPPRGCLFYDLSGRVILEVPGDDISRAEVLPGGKAAILERYPGGLSDGLSRVELIGIPSGETLIPGRRELELRYAPSGLVLALEWMDADGNFPDVKPAWLFDPATGRRTDLPGIEVYFLEGEAPWPARAEDGRYGYIDASGQWVIPPQYSRADRFQNGRAVVQAGDCRLIDTEGTVLAQGYTRLEWNGSRCVYSTDDAHLGLMDAQFRDIVPMVYDRIDAVYAADTATSLLALGASGQPTRLLDGNTFVAQWPAGYTPDHLEGRLLWLSRQEAVPGPDRLLLDLSAGTLLRLPEQLAQNASALFDQFLVSPFWQEQTTALYTLSGDPLPAASPFAGISRVSALVYDETGAAPLAAWVIRGPRQGYINSAGDWLYAESRWAALDD